MLFAFRTSFEENDNNMRRLMMSLEVHDNTFDIMKGNRTNMKHEQRAFCPPEDL